MACLYCGKRVSMVRQMADPDFCSDEHRRLYHDMARAALKSLGDLEDAPAEPRPPRTPGLRPKPQVAPRPAAIPPAAAARRRPAQAPGPRLVVVDPPPPPMCEPARGPVAVFDIAFGPLPASEIELSPSPVFYDDALAPARESIAARGPGGDEAYGFLSVPGISPAAELRKAVHLESAVRMAAPGLLMGAVESRRESLKARFGPFDFFVLEGRPRRRYARSRAIPPPRLAVRIVTIPGQAAVLALRGIAEAGAATHALAGMPGVYRPLIDEQVAPRGAAVRLPAFAAAPDGTPGAGKAGPESARACDFMNLAPAARRGALVPVLNRGVVRVSAAAAPARRALELRFGRTVVCGAIPLGAHSALASLRPIQAAGAVFDLAPVCRIVSPLPRRAEVALADCGVAKGIGGRPCAQAGRTRTAEPGPGAFAREATLPLLAAGACSGTPASGGAQAFELLPVRAAALPRLEMPGIGARAAALPPFAPRIGRGRVDTTNPIPLRCRPQNLESVPMDGIGGIVRPPDVRIPSVELAAGAHHDLPPSGPAPAKPPKMRMVASAPRFERVPFAGVLASALALPAPAPKLAPARRIDAGRVAPEPIAAAAGRRESQSAAVPFETSAVPPAPRAVRAPAAGAVLSAGEARYVALRALAHASERISGVSPFAPAPPTWQSLLIGMAAPGIRLAGFEHRNIAPATTPQAPSCASREFPQRFAGLPPCPAGEDLWKPAGLAVLPYRKGAPARAFAPESDFRREPRPAPAFRRPAISLGVSIPTAPVRRALDRLGLQPAGEVMRRLDRAAGPRHFESREAAVKLVMASRAVKISAAARLAVAPEIRRPLAAPARIAPLAAEGAISPVPPAVLPGSRHIIPAAPGGVTGVAALSLSPRATEGAGARQVALAVVAVQVRAQAAVPAAMTLPAVRAAASPYSPSLKRLGLPSPERRGEAARVALCHACPPGRFGVPANRAVLPRAGFPLFGFTLFEMLDYDDRRHARMKSVEELLPALVVPASKPAPRAAKRLLQPGEMTGFMSAQAGDRATVPAAAILSRGGSPLLPVLGADPDNEDRDEWLAAVPDRWEGGRMWKTASRFFR